MVLTTLLPIWRSWHIDPASALRQNTSRSTESRSAVRLRNSLVVTEVALTLTLSVVAVLLTQQLIRQSHEDLGFAADALLVLDPHSISQPPPVLEPQNPTPAALAAFKQQLYAVNQLRLAHLNALLEDVSHFPGVKSAAGILGAPMGYGGSDVGYAIRGRQVFAPPYQGLPNADIRAITPDLFTTMGIPLLRGRSITNADRAETARVVLINQALSRAVFPGQDPIGQQIVCGFSEAPTDWWTIIGVVGDIHDDSPAAAPRPTFYAPIAQHAVFAERMQLVVRAAHPAALSEALRQHLERTHPDVAVQAATMLDNVSQTQLTERFRTLLFASFSLISMLLAAVGIYGVTSYTVAQRRFEFSLRFALGATRSQVLTMVLKQALGTTAAGIALGIALSFGLPRVLSAVIGKLPPFDPAAFLLAAAGILFLALGATLVPAYRAQQTEPIEYLRGE